MRSWVRETQLRLRLFSSPPGFVDRAPRTYLKPHLFALTQTAPVCSFLSKKCSFLVCLHPHPPLAHTDKHTPPQQQHPRHVHTCSKPPRTHAVSSLKSQAKMMQFHSKILVLSLVVASVTAFGNSGHSPGKRLVFNAVPSLIASHPRPCLPHTNVRLSPPSVYS